MKVIKRKGNIQEFKLNKIKTSLIYAGETAGTNLNESDLKILLSDIYGMLAKTRGEDGLVSSLEIVGAIVRVLGNSGFDKLVCVFLNHEG